MDGGVDADREIYGGVGEGTGGQEGWLEQRLIGWGVCEEQEEFGGSCDEGHECQMLLGSVFFFFLQNHKPSPSPSLPVLTSSSSSKERTTSY